MAPKSDNIKTRTRVRLAPEALEDEAMKDSGFGGVGEVVGIIDDETVFVSFDGHYAYLDPSWLEVVSD